MELLAASRSEAAAGAVGLAAMMSCLLLMLYRPRRTELADTPHQVPAVAFAVAVGWIIMVLALSSWSGGKAPNDAAAQPELSPAALWVLCVASVVEIVVVGTAYLLPRAYAAARVRMCRQSAGRSIPSIRCWIPCRPPRNCRHGQIPAAAESVDAGCSTSCGRRYDRGVRGPAADGADGCPDSA